MLLEQKTCKNPPERAEILVAVCQVNTKMLKLDLYLKPTVTTIIKREIKEKKVGNLRAKDLK